MTHPAESLRWRSAIPRGPRKRKRLTRLALPFATAGLVALALPWSSASAGEKPAFSGYNTSAWAAPVKIEFYEPTIPIPATPQAEIEVAYTTVEAETGVARGRGSWIWPGDPLGEGFKTFADSFGLPEEIGKQGYPLQVNSVHPSGPEEQQDEPFPGMVMRTAASDKGVAAQVGYSPDGETKKPEGGGGDGPAPSPEPGLPTGELEDFGAAITGSGATATQEQDAGTPLLPPELSALVDFTSYSSGSYADTSAGEVVTTSESMLQGVSLFGGVVTIDGLSAEMVTTSNGTKSTAEGTRSLGTLAIAGNEFTVGPEGVEASGEQAPIPGLPDDAKKALKQLGISFSTAPPQEESEGDFASGLATGLLVEVDMTQLRSQLRDVPLDDVVGAIPDETGELKKLIQAAANLSPRIVFTLGNAGTATDTVQPLAIPGTPIDAGDVDTGGAAGAGAGAGGSAGAGVGSAGAPGASAPGAPADAGTAPAADGALADAAPAAAGLPPLNSIPGALLVGGIGLATAAGTWLRRIGLLALGGVGSCPHGLDSGLPDLRKA